jgi:hypothetical protein
MPKIKMFGELKALEIKQKIMRDQLRQVSSSQFELEKLEVMKKDVQELSIILTFNFISF